MSTLTHALQILNCFSEAEPELRLAEISRRVGSSKSNTHRLLLMLADEGLLRRVPNTVKYRLGLRLFQLGRLAVTDFDSGPIWPVMQDLARQTKETVVLGVQDEYEVVFLRKVDSPYPLRVSPGAMFRGSLLMTASGRALLAWQPEVEIDRVIHHEMEAPSVANVNPDAMLAVLAEVRKAGVATNEFERRTQIRTVAAPVRRVDGTVVAALAVSAPAQRFPMSEMPIMANRVRQGAADLSEQLNAAEKAGRPTVVPIHITSETTNASA